MLVSFAHLHFKREDWLLRKQAGGASNLVNSVEEVPSCSGPRYSEFKVPAYNPFRSHDISYCDSFYSQFPLSSLCKGGTTFDARDICGGTTLRNVTSGLIPEAGPR